MASLKEKMKAIRQSGLRTADLIEPGPELDERYKEALARLAEEERLKKEAEARPRDGDAPPAKRPMTERPPEREMSFVLERVGARLTATWREGAWLSRPGMERHWHARRTATLRTKADSRGVRASILFAYDADAPHGAAFDPKASPKAYKMSGQEVNAVSLLKSQLQKAVRRQNADVATRAARELMLSYQRWPDGARMRRLGGPREVLRRLLVAAVEDSTPVEGATSVLVWFLGAACPGDDFDGEETYELREADVAYVLGAVGAVANCPEGPTKKKLKVSHLEDVPTPGIVDSALDLVAARAFGDFGDFDGDLILRAASYFAFERPHVAPVAPVAPSSLARLRPQDMLLEAVDVHCGSYKKDDAPIFTEMFKIDPALRPRLGELRTWMANCRTFVNTRFGLGDPRRTHPEWHDVADAAARRLIAAAVANNPPW